MQYIYNFVSSFSSAQRILITCIYSFLGLDQFAGIVIRTVLKLYKHICSAFKSSSSDIIETSLKN